MPQRNKIIITSETLAAALYAIFAIQFSSLAAPWIAIFCGVAAAISLGGIPHRIGKIAFGSIFCLSLLPNQPWPFSQATAIFGFAAITVSFLNRSFEKLKYSHMVRRTLQFAPLLIITFMMPIPASFRSPDIPKVAFLAGGVWATADQLPLGSTALSTKHQYTYERFRKSLNASIVQQETSLDGIDELVIITPTTPFDATFIRSVKQWTERGGRLLIIADHTNLFGHQTVLQDLTKELRISIRPDALYETETNGGIYSNFAVKVAGLTPCSISKGVVPRLTMRGFSEHPDYTATSFFGELDPTDDDLKGNFPILGSRRYGLGEISVFTDSTFFANFACHRWSSQVVLGSLFWSTSSSILAIAGALALAASFVRSLVWLLPAGIALTLASPAVGFRTHKNHPSERMVKLALPEGVENASEERDRGYGASLLASAYAFDVSIDWNADYHDTFESHLQKKGIVLSRDPGDTVRIDVSELKKGRFFIDENSFWYGQGVGLLRSINMANFWRSIGAEIEGPEFSILESSDQMMIDSDDKVASHHVQKLSDDWAIIDQRTVARWIPQASRWLARKEWQLGPWLKKDLTFKPQD